MRWPVIWLPVGLLALMAGPAEPTQTSTALPPRLETYVTGTVKLSAEERRKLALGGPVTKLLATDASAETGVFGAIWISAPMQVYITALKDIENFERGGGFKITKLINTPPRLEDFAELHLPAEDVEDLRSCRVGDCELKLGEEALQRFRAGINWKSPTAGADADALMRELALRYVDEYLKGGNERLAVYRDRKRPTFVAREFRDMVDRMPELTTYMPDMRRYLLEFPNATLPAVTSFLYWQETEFGLKPTIRVSHVVIRQGPGDATIASKMLYATHYFWTGLELRALLQDPSRGSGFWFITVSRSRSDGLTGFTGTVLGGKVRREVEEGALAALHATKRALEAVRPAQ